jgi:hypothetical protein
MHDMGIIRWIAVLGVLGACGDSDGHDRPDGSPGSGADAAPSPDAAPPDAAPAPDGSPGQNDAGTDAAPGAPDAAPGPDGSPGDIDAGHDADAGPGGPAIESVTIDGEFVQVHQGASFEIRIAGTGLDGVTSVSFTDGTVDPPGSLVATPTEVRATMVVASAATPGPRDVTVSGADGSATAPGAIEVTPWVMGPDAAPDGRATFESPMLLADYAAREEAFGGIVLFLVGEHVSDQNALFNGSITIMGQGEGTTTVRSGLEVQVSSGAAALRDLTLVGNLFFSGSTGGIAVERVTMVGGTATLFGSGNEGVTSTADFDDFFYDGEGAPAAVAAIESLDHIRVSVTNSRFEACGTAINAGGVDMTLSDTVVEGCEFGTRSRVLSDSRRPGLTIGDCEFIDNRVGISAAIGNASVTNTSISDNEATAAASEVGISIGITELAATDVTITGQDRIGVSGFASGGSDSHMGVDLTRLLVVGGERGVSLEGFVDAGHLRMSSSRIVDQTVAAVSVGLVDLGVIDLRGGNELSVLSGFALEDVRVTPAAFVFIEAAGILLNGRSYTGLVEGIASVPPDYRITDRSGGIQF